MSKSVPTFAEELSNQPYLESVDGREFVRLERGGESFELYPGETLEPGDLIESGSGGCKIRIDGLTEISVSDNTKLQWMGVVSGSPEFNVSEGMIWANVVKTDPPPTPTPVPADPDAPVIEKYKFTLRTRAAVLGVRGTEFTVEYRNGASWFSTLEGEVFIAKNDAALKSGKQVERLKPEERIFWGVDHAPVRDQFKIQDYRSRLQKAHPRAFRLRHQARVDREDLRRFQKNLKRVHTGQTTNKARRVRTIFDTERGTDSPGQSNNPGSYKRPKKPTHPSKRFPQDVVPDAKRSAPGPFRKRTK